MLRLRLGFSPCPNDTFLFYALVHGRVDSEGLVFEPVLDDVETLNRWALEDLLPVSKVSYGVLDRLVDRYWCLRAGSAVGWGCGPLVVAREPISLEALLEGPIAVPGEHTTASLLLRLRAGKPVRTLPTVFHEIIPAVAEGRVAAGVIIHEGRFTYTDYGLHAIEDLGSWWERESALPIPLGGIVLRRDLPGVDPRKVERVLRRSVEWALANPEGPMRYVREHAQEMQPEVLREHVRLYVNRYTCDLGREGEKAVRALVERATAVHGAGPAPAALFPP